MTASFLILLNTLFTIIQSLDATYSELFIDSIV
jgi:hypothetical protein